MNKETRILLCGILIGAILLYSASHFEFIEKLKSNNPNIGYNCHPKFK
ncbi:hypothetical protein J4207_04345 [Candidatus Woesearchaeota archaeon]|nr:hypothetical protein [Candidatus Woesearchaeota archaeon]